MRIGFLPGKVRELRIINSHAQTVTNAAPQRVMNVQQKSAIAKLGHQGTPNQVIG